MLDLVADVRASTPTDAAKLVVPDVVQETHGVAQARLRMRQAVTGLVAREQAGLDAVRSRPALADPRVLLDARADELATLRDRARRCVRHALDRAQDDIGHQRARARALSPLATLERGYSVLQDADGHVLTSVDGVAAGAPVSVRVADGRIHADVTSTDQTDQRQPTRRKPMPEETPSYEAAREELLDVVRRLETGGSTLEESLALWERGEELARICQEWLDGARKRLDAVMEKERNPAPDES